MGEQADDLKPVGEEVLEENHDLIQQVQGTGSMLQVAHPVSACIGEVGRNGLVYPIG